MKDLVSEAPSAAYALTHLTIRPLLPTDFQALYQVFDSVAREERYLAFTAAPPVAEALSFYQHIVDANQVHMVAVWGDEVVGWCDALPSVGQARAHVATSGMGLVPRMRGKGIGRRLLEATITAAWAKGFERIELSVRTDNTVAKRLYAQIGFYSEGVAARALKCKSKYFDVEHMALLRDRIREE